LWILSRPGPLCCLPVYLSVTATPGQGHYFCQCDPRAPALPRFSRRCNFFFLFHPPPARMAPPSRYQVLRNRTGGPLQYIPMRRAPQPACVRKLHLPTASLLPTSLPSSIFSPCSSARSPSPSRTSRESDPARLTPRHDKVLTALQSYTLCALLSHDFVSFTVRSS